MKGLYKRIISGVLVLVTMFLMCSPVAFASSEGSLQSYQPETFWGWLQSVDNSSWNFWKSLLDKDICPKSPNTNGRHEFVKTHTTVDGKTGYFYVCKHCGKSAGEVGEEAYQQQVSDLPAPGYNSDGSLLWSPKIECFYLVYWPNRSYYVAGCQHYLRGPNDLDFNGVTSFDCDNHIVTARLPSGSSYLNLDFLEFRYSGVRPVDGFYFRVNTPKYEGYYTTTSGKFPLSSTYPVSSGSGYFYEASTSDSYTERVSPAVTNAIVTFHLQIFAPVYKVTPLEAIDTTQYSITTRPTTITGGNYGIVGDNGQITTVTNTTQIINEGDNIYYNPATGQTYTITDWTYNYDGRIYNITLDTGDKVSVEYGDENITITENTINEGDTIVNNYTIYYMIDGTGSGDNPSPTPGPTACPHEWLKTGERQATCLVPAQRTYTCSICGEQKTETDPVLGHSWHVIQTVTTQYDENGNLTQEGYTIYECERCGEQYKSTNDTGPPPSGGGGSGGGSGDNIFSGIFGLIWDFFTFLFDLFSEFVVGGIKGFIGGLKDAGSSFFSILNPFNWDYGG